MSSPEESKQITVKLGSDHFYPTDSSEDEKEYVFYELMKSEPLNQAKDDILSSLSLNKSEEGDHHLEDPDSLIVSTVENFYKVGVEGIIKRLKIDNLAPYCDRFVELLIKSSFDKDRISAMHIVTAVPSLYHRQALTRKEIILGLEKIVQNIDDIELDAPYCALKSVGVLKYFIREGCLYPEYLKMLPQVFYEHVQLEQKIAMDAIVESRVRSKDIDDLKVYIKNSDRSIEKHLSDLMKYRKMCERLLNTLYGENDVEKITKFLRTSNIPHLTYEFLRIYIKAALFLNQKKQDVASKTIDALHSSVLSPSDIKITYIRLVGSAPREFDDLKEAEESLCKFLATSILDDVISFSFLKNLSKLHVGGLYGMSLLKRTMKWVKNNKKLDVPKDGTEKEDLHVGKDECLHHKVKIFGMISRLLKHGDSNTFKDLVARSNFDGAMVEYMIKMMLKMSMEKKKSEAFYWIVDLMGSLVDQGIVEKDVIKSAFHQVKNIRHLMKEKNSDIESDISTYKDLLKGANLI